MWTQTTSIVQEPLRPRIQPDLPSRSIGTWFRTEATDVFVGFTHGGASASGAKPDSARPAAAQQQSLEGWCTPGAAQWMAHRQGLQSTVSPVSPRRQPLQSVHSSFRLRAGASSAVAAANNAGPTERFKRKVEAQQSFEDVQATWNVPDGVPYGSMATSTSFTPPCLASANGNMASSLSHATSFTPPYVTSANGNMATSLSHATSFAPQYTTSANGLPANAGPLHHRVYDPRQSATGRGSLHDRGNIGKRGAADGTIPTKRSRRPHLLTFALEDATVNVQAVPDAQAAWYELARCFLSLHPSSARMPQAPDGSVTPTLPQDTPQETVDGIHAVSQAVVLRRVATDGAADTLQAELQETLKLRTERLHHHCILYLWCRKQSFFGEEVSLLGSRVLPLRDESLYGRLAAWDVAHAHSGEQVAEVRMRCSVATAPGAIQLPHLVTVEPTSVEFKWSPPVEENGRPVIGYMVALLEPCSEDWITLCECNASTSFELRNLIPGTAYLVDVRAVNEVGVGEHCELEVLTATESSEGELSGEEFDIASDGNPERQVGLASHREQPIGDTQPPQPQHDVADAAGPLPRPPPSAVAMLDGPGPYPSMEQVWRECSQPLKMAPVAI